MYRQSARRSHQPGGRLPVLSARPAVTFPAAQHHRPLAVPLLGDRHIGVNNLPKVVTQLWPREGFEPTPVDRKSNALPVGPPIYYRRDGEIAISHHFQLVLLH